MTDNEHIKPLDLSRYEGHTPGPWRVVDDTGYLAEWDECGGVETDDQHIAFTFSHDEPDARLIADAPLLLAELVKARAENQRLRSSLRYVTELMDVSLKIKGFPENARKIVDEARRVLGEEGGEA